MVARRWTAVPPGMQRQEADIVGLGRFDIKPFAWRFE
jgi:hypothetical protein